ncbi:MAG: methyltransferase domain-containing protein [Patescibacteria group bacterium]|nr:methyltransferase domain-containing protein [Patescibacteria group bacterium]MDD4304303.1 methyltransferase domain-containing protein [Patescibacteria group bacterium]MDD4695670.1 methyltransferase domain-containing protein [Patescibacteria group bacterium]
MSNKNIIEQYWNKVYSKHPSNQLPWFNIKIPKIIIANINKLDKNKKLLIPGCGTGETVKFIKNLGFNDIIGTDISSTAIKIAKKQFSNIVFYKIETEKLDQNRFLNSNIFDWLNLHQISPKKLNKYLLTLQKISNFLIITYIFEPELGKVRNSYITEAKVYNHDPEKIIKILKGLALKHRFNFVFSINKKFGTKKHNAECLIFEKCIKF